MRRAAGSSIVVLILAMATASAASGSTPAPSWPTHPHWQRYVVAPSTSDVIPVRVVGSSGLVSGAASLTDASGGHATLTMTRGKSRPTIVLDYGKDVGGVPYFEVRSESGSPVLRSSYSEAGTAIGAAGDRAPSNSGAGDLSRVDDMTISSARSFSRGLIQGGERYELVTLASPGTVTLSAVGIHFTAVRAPAKDFRGWFDSSSEQLDRIWYDGAYTTQLDELPARTLPQPWRITDGTLETDGGDFGVLRTGHAWTDYSVSFDTQIEDSQSGWMVRASSPSSGYLFFIDDATDKTGPPGALQEIAFGPTSYAVIADVPLPKVTSGVWYRVQTVTAGPHITTSIDGHQVATFDTGALPAGAPVYGSGTVGFAAPGTDALFRDLDARTPSGQTLFSDRLSRSSVIADFTDPNLVTPDPLPVIMDGAKRDRVVWSGDLGVEGPNVFVTTAADSYVRGSLQLLASYQEASGESGTNVPPTVPVGTFPESGDNYSTSYSMDEVDNVATYFLYTGDLRFVHSQWPMITRELTYNASLVDSRGLLATDGIDGMDWDYYDGSKTGEVSAYNDIYYETLIDAASLADALGLTGPAHTYRQQAALLRAAINRYLYDPSTKTYAVSNLQPGTVAQDGTSLAVVFGVAPSGQAPAIEAALEKVLPSTPFGPLPFSANTGYRKRISPFVTNEEVQALFDTGATNSAVALMRTVWGHMDAPGPDDTDADWEVVGADGLPGLGAYTSLAHGWASGATADLTSYVLGVQPSTAGFATWSVQPHPGSLSWVEGDVPTPHGTIDVRWADDHPSGRLTLTVTAPTKTSGTISIPVPKQGAVVTVGTINAAHHHQRRVVRTTPGLRVLLLRATGGVTYDVDVAPR
jgi:alpha-L-rhamnosidase